MAPSSSKAKALVSRSEGGASRGSEPRAQVQAVAARLLARLASLDFQCFEHMAADVAVPHMAAGPLRELDHVLLEVVRLSAQGCLLWGALPAEVAVVLQATEAMQGEGQEVSFAVVADACHEGSVPILDDTFVNALPAWSQHAASLPAGDARLGELGCAVAEAMAHLMRQRARLRLQAALVDKWGMVAIAEAARRDARFWLRGLLVALGFNRPNGLAWQAVGPDLLGEALAVRELLMRLRADVLTCADLGLSLSHHDVGLQLREIDLRILATCGGRHYAWVRVTDRQALAGFHRRLQDWLGGDWEDVAAARQLLVELAGFAEGLAGVNQRRVLQAHDREVQAQALGLLQVHGTHAGTAGSSPMHELQALLERLRWRSEELGTFLGHHDELALPHDADGLVQARRTADVPLTQQNVADLMAIVRAAMGSAEAICAGGR